MNEKSINFEDVPSRCEVEGCNRLNETFANGKHLCGYHFHQISSPVTRIMRRETHKRGYKVSCRRKKVRTVYPRVEIDTRKTPDEIVQKIMVLYSNGMNFNRISKIVGVNWHSVKMILVPEYAEKRRKMSNDRMKRILGDPVQRKVQFGRVDRWKKRRIGQEEEFAEFQRGCSRKASKKYDDLNREKRRKSAITRHQKIIEKGKVKK